MNLPNTKTLGHQTPQPETNRDLSRVCEIPLKLWASFVYYFLSLWVNHEILLAFSSKRCMLSIDSHLQFYLSLNTSPTSLCTPTPILPSHLYPQMMIQVIFSSCNYNEVWLGFFFLLFINTLPQDLSSHCSETKIVHFWREPSHLFL